MILVIDPSYRRDDKRVNTKPAVMSTQGNIWSKKQRRII